jgi:hypothetical protein
MSWLRMAASSTQGSKLVRRQNYQRLEVILNVQIGNNISLGLSNIRYLFEQCWKVEKYIPKVRRKICAVNCNFFALQDL